MRKGELNRDQAIQIVGESAVRLVDRQGCNLTDRIMDNGEVEFAASVSFLDLDDNTCTITAYYYQDNHDVSGAESLEDLDWEVNGYEIE